MRLGRVGPLLGSSCQRLFFLLLDGPAPRPSVFGASGVDCALHVAALEDLFVTKTLLGAKVSSGRYDLRVSRAGTTSVREVSEYDIRLRCSRCNEPRFYNSEKRSAGADDIDAPVAIDYSSLLEEETFHDLADDVLHRLQEKIEVYGEDLNVDGFDSDYASGVLTVRLGSLGTYVINKQTPNRQIWLSSPVSGPGRFDWSESHWIYRRRNEELVSLLEKEFSQLLGSTIHLS